MNNADDHMRMIKATLKNTFPGGVGPLTNEDGGFTAQSDGSASKPAFAFASEPTLGLYRSAAGVLSITGGKLTGALPVGHVSMFIAPPASLGTATANTGKDWLELNGASYNYSDYPALGTLLGVSSGTFTLPDMYTLGRFPRSRTAATAVRTAQANTVGPHTHPDVTPTTAAETQEHTHTFSGSTGGQSNTHTHQYDNRGGGQLDGGGGPPGGDTNPMGATTGANNQDHTHAFSGTTNGRSATHNHTVTVSTPANTGTTETRPEAMSFIFAVKT
jgi:hypothetical protein